RRRIQQHIEGRAVRDRCEQLLSTGRQELEAGNYNKAIEAFSAAARLDPNDAEAARLLQNAQTGLQRIERANALLEQAQQEIAVDNLTGAARLADEFFEEALVLLSDLQIAYPAANRVHELMLSVRQAQQERDRRERL